MPSLLVGFGAVLIALALLLLHDGSEWGLVIAWVLGTWGGTLVAWGLLTGWHHRVVACVASAAFALAAVLVALLFVPDGGLDRAIMCAVASGLALILSVAQICHLRRRRSG